MPMPGRRPSGLARPSAVMVAAIALGAGALVAGVAGVAGAAGNPSFVVNTTADAHDAAPGDGVCADSLGQCTLRAAIEEADALAAGTAVAVTVPAGIYKLKLGGLSVTGNTVTVTGAGGSATVVKGDGKSAVVTVAAKAQVALAQLELTKGGPSPKGGGGLANSGTTSLDGVLVTANTSASGGGLTNAVGATMHLSASTVSANVVVGVADSRPGGSGGGIANAGVLTLANTTVTGNGAGEGGFGLNDTGGSGGNGGGIANTGRVTATASTISDNYAGSGGPGNQEIPGNGGGGGGVYSSAGSVTLDNTTVSGNAAGSAGADETGDGPANAGNGGGVWSKATLDVQGSTFSANTGGTGGTGTSGGGTFNAGTATIASSTFTANTAGAGYLGLAGNGGGLATTGTLSLSDSTFTDNVAGAGAAGSGEAGGNGGGLDVGAGSATLTGDTFDANAGGAGGSAPYVDPGGAFGGPGGNGGGLYSTATLTATDVTVTANATGLGGANSLPYVGSAGPGVGGGLATGGGSASLRYVTVADNSDGITRLAGTVTLGGTIVADSTGANCTGAIAETSGFNLDSGTTCGFAASTDITGAEPLLGALASNGGPTATQALLSGSPAVDHGGTAATGCPATDQRGQSRPDEAADNGTCDIGAYESSGLR